MPQFRKKPVVVEAEQFRTGWPQWPRGVTGARLQHNRVGERDYWPAGSPVVVTIHGQTTLVADGDWIITEPDGIHHYPCKPDIFAATYEPVAGAGRGAVAPEDQQAWRCKARASLTDPPQDCDWPHCGCDPYADKVLEALVEQGYTMPRDWKTALPAEPDGASPEGAEPERVLGPDGRETAASVALRLTRLAHPAPPPSTEEARPLDYTLESPNFVPQALKDLAARDYKRIPTPSAPVEEPALIQDHVFHEAEDTGAGEYGEREFEPGWCECGQPRERHVHPVHSIDVRIGRIGASSEPVAEKEKP